MLLWSDIVKVMTAPCVVLCPSYNLAKSFVCMCLLSLFFGSRRHYFVSMFLVPWENNWVTSISLLQRILYS